MDSGSPTPTADSPNGSFRKFSAMSSVRSCLMCHRRKVRCDRRQPCNHCTKNNIPCVFPTANKPRRTNTGSSSNGNGDSSMEDEITARLHKLEGIVEDLRGQVPKKTRATGANAFSQPYGKLLLDDFGKGKYLHSAFWMHINTVLEQYINKKWPTFQPAPSIPEPPSIADPLVQAAENSSHTFIYGPIKGINLQNLHPLPSQIPYLWRVWKSNVEPMTRCFHIPTMEKILEAVANDMRHLPPAVETLLFTIYYGAITSMDEEDVKRDMAAEKSLLLQRYRFAIEQGLAKSQFLTMPEMVTFQSLALFLLFLRKNGDFRHSAGLIPLVVRTAQSLGLHRDGSHLGSLGPYRTEMQRRIYWAVIVLDRRASEDMAMDPMICEGTFDAQVPLNLNDGDLTPHAAFAPPERKGLTDMTFVLIRIKTLRTSTAVQRMIRESCKTLKSKEAIRRVEERCDEMWSECLDFIKEHYIGDAPEPIKSQCECMAQLIIAKLRLMAKFFIPTVGVDGEPPTLRKPPCLDLVVWSSEMFEFNHKANHNQELKPFRWVFVSYYRWHGSAIMLTEMLRHPWSSVLERGWEAMHVIFQDSGPGELEQLAERTIMLVPFQQLYHLVTEYRESELRRLRSDPDAARRLHAETEHPTNLGLFYNRPDAEIAAKADKRWRQLVGLHSETSKSSPADVEEKETGYNKLYDVIMGSREDESLPDAVGLDLNDPAGYDLSGLTEQQMQDFYEFSGV